MPLDGIKHQQKTPSLLPALKWHKTNSEAVIYSFSVYLSIYFTVYFKTTHFWVQNSLFYNISMYTSTGQSQKDLYLDKTIPIH